MKAFLLAGGHGTRLKPLTDSIPKCLLPICGTPMLQIWFDLCRRYGIDEVLINLHTHGEAVRQFIEKNKNDLEVHLFEEETLLGSAGTLLANRGSNSLARKIFADDPNYTTSRAQGEQICQHIGGAAQMG